jgi:hypothetical protein
MLHPRLGSWVAAVRGHTSSAALADVYELLRGWEAEAPQLAARAGAEAHAALMQSMQQRREAASGTEAPAGEPAGPSRLPLEEFGQEVSARVSAGGDAAAAVGATAHEGATAAGQPGDGGAAEADASGSEGEGGEELSRAALEAAAAAHLDRLHAYVRGGVMDTALWLLRYGSPYLQGVAASILGYATTPSETAWLAAAAAVPASGLLNSPDRYASQVGRPTGRQTGRRRARTRGVPCG